MSKINKKWELISWATFRDVDVAIMTKKSMEDKNEKIGQKIELEIKDMDKDGMRFGIYRKIK